MRKVNNIVWDGRNQAPQVDPEILTQEVSGDAISIPVSVRILSNLSYNEAKAIALVVYIRAIERASKRQRYTINSIRELTSIHTDTLSKMIKFLKKMNLVAIDKDNKINFLTIKSNHKNRNQYAQIVVAKKIYKSVEKIILALRMRNRLNQIDKYRTVLTRYHEIKAQNKPNRGTLDEFKKLGRWLREHCKTDYRNENFKEYGWSYKKIAEYLGVSIQTAVSVVKFAVENNLILKTRRIETKRLSHESELEFADYTFCSHGILYKVYANLYSVL